MQWRSSNKKPLPKRKSSWDTVYNLRYNKNPSHRTCQGTCRQVGKHSARLAHRPVSCGHTHDIVRARMRDTKSAAQVNNCSNMFRQKWLKWHEITLNKHKIYSKSNWNHEIFSKKPENPEDSHHNDQAMPCILFQVFNSAQVRTPCNNERIRKITVF